LVGYLIRTTACPTFAFGRRICMIATGAFSIPSTKVVGDFISPLATSGATSALS